MKTLFLQDQKTSCVHTAKHCSSQRTRPWSVLRHFRYLCCMTWRGMQCKVLTLCVPTHGCSEVVGGAKCTRSVFQTSAAVRLFDATKGVHCQRQLSFIINLWFCVNFRSSRVRKLLTFAEFFMPSTFSYTTSNGVVTHTLRICAHTRQ